MSSSYEVFIPFSNEKVWVPALGAMGILLRIREKNSGRSHRDLQPEFETWAVENMTYDWGMEARDNGMVFQFGEASQATLFKLMWHE
jgi:hypothetical protein